MMMVAGPLVQVGASLKLVVGDHHPFPPLGVLLKLVDDPLSCALVVGACLVAGGKLVVVDLKKRKRIE